MLSGLAITVNDRTYCYESLVDYIEDRAACEADVKRHCQSAIPDQLRVLGCLQDNRKRISQACQGVLVKYGQ